MAWNFVGRIEQISPLLAVCDQDDPAVVIMSGAPGIGMSSLLDQVARRATRGTRAPIRPHARAGHTAFGLLGPLLPAGFGAGTPQWTAVSEAARPIVDRVGGGTHGARRGSGWPAAVALSAPAAGPQQPPSTGDPRVLAVAR